VNRVFISDCEGPISKNDNAFEVTSHFVPAGDKIFSITSRYDDVLSDLAKKPGYNAGDTLKLVVPFLKAYDVTDQLVREFSARNLVLIPDVKNTLEQVRDKAPTYIVSTSYEHYIEALCQAIDFPFGNTYCTKLCLDKYELKEQERNQLKKIGEEIAEMQIFEIPQGANSLKDLPFKTQVTIHRLDEIFWVAIEKMQIGKIYSEVNPIGGVEKAKAVKDVTRRLPTTLADVMYVGDSITDKEAFGLVKENDGLTVSFNGNQYAVENADIAVMSPDSAVTAVLAEAFVRSGKRETLELVANWNRQTLANSSVDDNLKKWFFQLHPHELPKARIVSTENMGKLAKESSEFRKKVRGEAVGRLG
jgi:energy-converting hydrogenase A subunit R